MGKLFKTPFLMRKCDTPKCERQAHFTIKNARLVATGYICDKCAYLLKIGGDRVAAWNEFQAQKNEPNLAEQLEGDDLPPGDEEDVGTTH